ncbi:MAG: hypothetical protein ND866_22450 [Pyrinomonadaceae bacterium]|nr:hypothetical protein [Pyrinomonadaceae bacterium]
MKRNAVTGATLGVLLLLAPLHANAQAGGDQWRFTLTPYLWLPNVDGTLKFSVPPGASGSPSVAVGPNDYLENLDFALMLAGEARRGNWAIISDLIYLDFAGESSAVRSVGGTPVTVNQSTSTGLKGLVWELAASYTVARSPAATLEVLGGFRYFGVEASVQWQLAGPSGQLPQAGSHTENVDLWDAIAGVRGRVMLGGGNWYVPYYLDAGAGSSALTWQGLTGIGYAFRWGDVLLAYRHLYYDQNGDKLFQDFSFSGPALGVSFRF